MSCKMNHTQHVTMFTFYVNEILTGTPLLFDTWLVQASTLQEASLLFLLTFSFCILEQGLRTTAVSAS